LAVPAPGFGTSLPACRDPPVCSGSARRFRRRSPTFADRTHRQRARDRPPRAGGRGLAASSAVKLQSGALTLDASSR